MLYLNPFLNRILFLVFWHVDYHSIWALSNNSFAIFFLSAEALQLSWLLTSASKQSRNPENDSVTYRIILRTPKVVCNFKTPMFWCIEYTRDLHRSTYYLNSEVFLLLLPVFANVASGWYLRVYRGVFRRGKWKTITSIRCCETGSVFCHHVEGSVWTSLSWGSRKSNVASSSTVTVVGARHQHWRCSSQKASVQLWVHTLRHEVFLKHLFHDFNKNDRWLETLLLRKEKKSYRL